MLINDPNDPAKVFRENLVRSFSQVVNASGMDNALNTPDYILAEYLVSCLDAYTKVLVSNARHRRGNTDANQ